MIAGQVKRDMMETRIRRPCKLLEASMIAWCTGKYRKFTGVCLQETQNAFKVLIGSAGIPIGDMAESLVRLNPD